MVASASPPIGCPPRPVERSASFPSGPRAWLRASARTRGFRGRGSRRSRAPFRSSRCRRLPGSCRRGDVRPHGSDAGPPGEARARRRDRSWSRMLDASGFVAADDQDRAARQRDRRVSETGMVQNGTLRKSSRSGIVELGRSESSVDSMSADDEHAAIGKNRRCVIAASLESARSWSEDPGRGVVDLRARRRTACSLAAQDQDLSVSEANGRVTLSATFKRADPEPPTLDRSARRARWRRSGSTRERR